MAVRSARRDQGHLRNNYLLGWVLDRRSLRSLIQDGTGDTYCFNNYRLASTNTVIASEAKQSRIWRPPQARACRSRMPHCTPTRRRRLKRDEIGLNRHRALSLLEHDL